MPMCTNSIGGSLRGSTCGAIPRISETIAAPSTGWKIHRSTRSPFAGGYGFPFDPHLHADNVALVWLPQLDPATVLLIPAPTPFSASRSLGSLTPIFRRLASDGEHWVVSDAEGSFPLLLTGGFENDTPVASVSPFDANFAARADPALRLWRLLTGERSVRSADSLTQLQRQQLAFSLRALDAHLAGATYREIAEVLFGEARVPTGSSWKTHDLRGRTIRLVRAGLRLMRGGYLDLLRHTRRRPR
jgi:hypothetical protein